MAWQCKHSLFLLCNQPATRKECAVDVVNKLIDMVISSYVMRSVARPLITEMAMMDFSHRDMFLSDFFQKLNESKSVRELLLHLSPDENLELEKSRYVSYEREEMSETPVVLGKSPKYRVNESEVILDDVSSLYKDDQYAYQDEKHEVGLKIPQDVHLEHDEMYILSNLLYNLKIEDGMENNDKANERTSVSVETVPADLSELKNRKSVLQSELDLNQLENNKYINYLKKITSGSSFTNLNSLKNQRGQDLDSGFVLNENSMTKTLETDLARDKNKTMSLVDYPVREDHIFHTHLDEKSLFLPDNETPTFKTRMIGENNVDTNGHPDHLAEKCFHLTIYPETDDNDTADFKMPNALSDGWERKYVLQSQTLTSSHDSNLLQLSDLLLNAQSTDLPNEQVGLNDGHSDNVENAAILLSEIFSDLFFSSPLQSVIREQITVNCDSILGSGNSLNSEPRDFNAVSILESAITGILINTKELENKIKKIETKTKDERLTVHFPTDEFVSERFTATVSGEKDHESEIVIENEIDNIDYQSDHEYENHTLNHKLNNEGSKSVTELANIKTLDLLDYDLVNKIQRDPSIVEDILKNSEPAKLDKLFDNEDLNYISTPFLGRYESVEEEWKQFLQGIDIPEYSVDIATPGVISNHKFDEKSQDVIVENDILETQSSFERSRTGAMQYGNDSAANPNSNSNMEEGHHLYVHLNQLTDKANLDSENDNSKDFVTRKESPSAKFSCLNGRNNLTSDIGILERNMDNISDSNSTSMTESINLKRNSFRTQIQKNKTEESEISKEILIGKQSSSFDANRIPIGTDLSNFHIRNSSKTHNDKGNNELFNKFHVNLDKSSKDTNLNGEVSKMIDIFMGKGSSNGLLLGIDNNEYSKLYKETNRGSIDNDNDTSCESINADDSSKTSSLTKERVNKNDDSENKLVNCFYKEANFNDRSFIRPDYINDGLKMFSDSSHSESNTGVNWKRRNGVNDVTEVNVTCVSQTDILLTDFSKSSNCKKKGFNDKNASLEPRGRVYANKGVCKNSISSKSINPKLDNTVLDTHVQRSKRSDVIMDDRNDIIVYFDPSTGKENRYLEVDRTVYPQSNSTYFECRLDVSNSLNKSSTLIGNNEDINNRYVFVDEMADKASFLSEKTQNSNLNLRGKDIRSESKSKQPISIKNKISKTKTNENPERKSRNALLVVEVSNNSSGSCDLSCGLLSRKIGKPVIGDTSFKRLKADDQNNSDSRSFSKRSVSNKSSDSSVLENLSDLFFNAEESLWKKDEKSLKANGINTNVVAKPGICVSNDTQSLPFEDIRYETKDEDILPCETVESIPVTESFGLFPNIIDNILLEEDRNRPNDSIYGIINENINGIQSLSVSLESADPKQTDTEDTDKVYEKLLNNESDYITYTNELNLNFDISRSNIIKTENLYIRKSLLDVFFENEGLDIITKNELIHLFALEETKIVDRIYEKQQWENPLQSQTISSRDLREDAHNICARKIKNEENKNVSLKYVVNETRIRKGADTFENDARLKKLQLNCCFEFVSKIWQTSPYFVLVNGSSDNVCSWIRYPQSTINNQNLSLSEISLAKSYFFNFCWKNVFKDLRKNSNVLVVKSTKDFVEKSARSTNLMRSILPNNSLLNIIVNLGDKQSSKIKRLVKSVNKIPSIRTQISNRENAVDNVEHSSLKEQRIASSKLNYVTITFVWCLSGGICVFSFLYTIFLLMDGEHVQEHWT